MACYFYLESKRKNGLSPIFIRVQDPKHKLDIRQATKLLIEETIWQTSRDSKEYRTYCKNPQIKKIFDDTDEIRNTIDQLIEDGKTIDKDSVRQLISDIIYRDEREATEAAAAEAARLEAEANRVTLRKFIEQFRKDIKAGKRLTDKGTVYAPGTINAINQACERLKKFEKKMKREYDFDDIDMNFYRDYTAYLNEQGYAINTTGKCIKQLKAIMALAQSEGLHSNSKYQDKRFKGTRVEVDSIYLTKEDLKKMMAVDLSKRTYGFDLARDIFMVGVWTAQRVSDYNNIRPEDIEVYTKRSIVDVPDPENPGKTIEKIEKKEIRVINIRQKKTGTKVAIPCSSELLRILQKYNFDIPKLSDQNINDNIKEVARLAGLTEIIKTESTKGGKKTIEEHQKWELVHSHTARRTGATLMYLAGMDIYDIMKITGHSTPIMLKKYIKADELEVVDKITDKYDYFD
jgi:integrase